jgi:benzil reductase ((S)-benzoin forming)
MGNLNDKSAYIITGTTRGIGRALAEEIVRRGHTAFCISRTPETQSPDRRNYTCDLRDPDQIGEVMHRVMHDLRDAYCRDAVLINNAGMLAPIGSLEKSTFAQMADSMHVNLMAPILLMSWFIRESDAWSIPRRIINMTSGAAGHAYAGWSLYCAAKAAMNMITRCTALEQSNRPDGAAISAVAPGVVDTDMQALIRDASDTDFPARSRFLKLRDEGRLVSPAQVAALILDLDAGGWFQSSGVYDLRDVEWVQGKPRFKSGG